MSYRLLCDENVEQTAVTALESRGFDAVHVTDRPGSSTPDGKVAQTARNEGRLLLTNDADFLDRTRYSTVQVLYYQDNRLSGPEVAARVDTLREFVPDQSNLASVTYLTDPDIRR